MRSGETSGRTFHANNSGSVAVEFALLAPIFFAMLLGVLQIGIGMQNYNAVRNVASDVSREVMIEYLTSNEMSADQIEQTALATAISAPYLLDSDNLTIEVQEASTQRIDGAHEFELEITYEIWSILTFMGFDAPTIDHERPIFVIDEGGGSGT